VSHTSEIPTSERYCRQWPVLYEDNHLLALYTSGVVGSRRCQWQRLFTGSGKGYLKPVSKPGRVFLDWYIVWIIGAGVVILPHLQSRCSSE